MPPNVLLVVMDGVRARNTSLLGYENETTPALDRFAGRATTYTRARAPAIWSLPSHASIFTGLEVAEHGVTDLGDGLRPGTTVWERLADRQGYATGVFSENTWLVDKDVGLKDAFETVEGAQHFPYPEADDPNLPYHRFASRSGLEQWRALIGESAAAESSLQTFINGLTTELAWDHPGLLPENWGAADTPGAVYTDRFLEWQDDRSGPWAACINYLDAHFPYEPPARYDEWGGETIRSLQAAMDDQVWEFNGGNRPWWQRKALMSLYDGGIRYVDAEIDRLLAGLESRGALEDTLVVVTADHGEGFGEPSRIRPNMRIPAHLAGLHEVLLQVPLVVKWPGQSAGETVEDLATLTAFPDVVESALDDAGPRRGFAADGPVFASSHGLEKPMIDRASRFVADTWRFDGDAYAVYDETDAGIRKRMTWREYDCEVTIPAPDAAYVSGEGCRDAVEEAFASLPDRDVSETGSDSIGEAARRDLEALGYL